MAGEAQRRTVSDQHDRRCHQPSHARFVKHDSTEDNMRLLWSYLENNGRPLSFYSDLASLFSTALKTARDEPHAARDRAEMPPTQIGRALQELGIVWIPAHSPQAKAYASYCTSCEPRTPFSGKRCRLVSLTPGAFRGGLGPGSSYIQSFRSFTGSPRSSPRFLQVITHLEPISSRSDISSSVNRPFSRSRSYRVLSWYSWRRRATIRLLNL